MRTRLEWKWEQLDESTWRAKVFSGWVVLHVKTFVTVGKKESSNQSESMVFVPDNDHRWSIMPPISDTPPVKKPSLANDF